MKLRYIVPALFLLLTACVTQQQMEDRFYRSMQNTTHLDISNHELIIPECTQEECFAKYGNIQDLIDAEKYQEAVDTAVNIFGLDTSAARKISVVDHLGEERPTIGGRGDATRILGQTSAILTITLSKAAFESAPYLVSILIHEIGHAINFHKYYDIIKATVGIDQRIPNHFLAQVCEAFTKDNIDSLTPYIRRIYHLGFIQEERLVYEGMEITAPQLTHFLNLLVVYLDVDRKYLGKLDEADVSLFALKHRERLYLPWHAAPTLLQIQNLHRGFQNSFHEGWRLEIETGIMTELRQTFNEFPDTEKEKFKRALMSTIEQKKREIETYLVENGL